MHLLGLEQSVSHQILAVEVGLEVAVEVGMTIAVTEYVTQIMTTEIVEMLEEHHPFVAIEAGSETGWIEIGEIEMVQAFEVVDRHLLEQYIREDVDAFAATGTHGATAGDTMTEIDSEAAVVHRQAVEHHLRHHPRKHQRSLRLALLSVIHLRHLAFPITNRRRSQLQ